MLRRKLTEVLRAADGRRQPRRQGVAEFMEVYPREELFMTSVAELADSPAGAAAARAHADQAVPAQGRLRPVCLVPDLPVQGPVQHQGRVCGAGDPARGSRRRAGRLQRRRGRGPVARLHLVVRAERGRSLLDADRGRAGAAIAAAVRSWDDDLVREAVGPLGERAGRELLADIRPDRSRRPTRPTCRRRPRSPTSRRSRRCASRARHLFEMWESAGLRRRRAVIEPDGASPARPASGDSRACGG